jgi:hypothetical protein
MSEQKKPVPRVGGYGAGVHRLDQHCLDINSETPPQPRPRLSLDPSRLAAARERLGMGQAPPSAAAAVAAAAAAPSLSPDEAHPRVPVRQLLVERYPAAFTELRPLKVGIKKDVRAEIPSISRQALHGFFKKYCNSPAYLRLLAEGTSRFDLSGNVAGAVTPAQAEKAAELLREIAGDLDGGRR